VEMQDPKNLTYQPPATLQLGIDGDEECERQRLQGTPDPSHQPIPSHQPVNISNPNKVLEDNIGDDDDTCLPELEEKTRNVFIELLSNQELQVSSNSKLDRILPVVTYEGHSIYKSTLVSQLNGNPYIYKDMLTRMKNPIYFNNSDDYLATTLSTTFMLFGLGCDVGVYFKDERGNASSTIVRATTKRKRDRPMAINSGAVQGNFFIGQV